MVPVGRHGGAFLFKGVNNQRDFPLADDIAQSDFVGLLGGNRHFQISLRETENQVPLADSLDLPLVDLLNHTCSMKG